MLYKKIISLTLLSLIFLSLTIVPVLAQNSGGNTAPPSEVGINNPLGDEDMDVQSLVGKIINAFLGFLGTIALVMVIWGGLTWMTSAGNEQKIKQGKDTLLWAILGLAVVFLSYTILTMVFNVLEGNPIF